MSTLVLNDVHINYLVYFSITPSTSIRSVLIHSHTHFNRFLYPLSNTLYGITSEDVKTYNLRINHVINITTKQTDVTTNYALNARCFRIHLYLHATGAKNVNSVIRD